MDLLVPIRNAALGQVIRGHFDGDAVPGQNTDPVSAQFSGKVGENDAVYILVEPNAEQTTRELLNNGSSNFNAVLFTHCPPTTNYNPFQPKWIRHDRPSRTCADNLTALESEQTCPIRLALAMISLKRSIDENHAREAVFREAIQSYGAAIESLHKHINETYPALALECGDSLSRLSSALAGPLDVEALAGSKKTLSETVNRMREHASREEESRASELRTMAKLVATISETFASRLNQGSVELGRFASEIEEIAACTNLPELRGRLRDRVQAMKDYVERTAQQDQETISTMESNLRALHERMRIQEALSGVDSTTQLSNRDQIAQHADWHLRRQGRPCLILLAVNRFQLIVRRFGPMAGDLVLKEFARRLGRQAEESERTARWGETQFMVLMDCPLQVAIDRSRRFQEAVSGRYLIRAEGRFIRLDISATVGVTESREEETMEQAAARAAISLDENEHPPLSTR